MVDAVTGTTDSALPATRYPDKSSRSLHWCALPADLSGFVQYGGFSPFFRRLTSQALLSRVGQVILNSFQDRVIGYPEMLEQVQHDRMHRAVRGRAKRASDRAYLDFFGHFFPTKK